MGHTKSQVHANLLIELSIIVFFLILIFMLYFGYSGYGQNLSVSTHAWENVFVLVIAVYGMATFTFFIGNMQVGWVYNI